MKGTLVTTGQLESLPERSHCREVIDAAKTATACRRPVPGSSGLYPGNKKVPRPRPPRHGQTQSELMGAVQSEPDQLNGSWVRQGEPMGRRSHQAR